MSAEVERVAKNLTRLSGVLPASSQTDDQSYYSRGASLDIPSTQTMLLERTGFVCVVARMVGWHDLVPLDINVILDIHRGIFQPAFGDATLGFRFPPERGDGKDDDGVEFPIWVKRGNDQAPVIVTRRGVRARQVPRRVGEACADFVDRADAAVGDVDLSALLLTRLYVRLIRIHPFGDGNGRTAWSALQFAAGRLRFPFVQSTPTNEARLALGDAIRNGQRIDRLVEHVKSAAWAQ